MTPFGHPTSPILMAVGLRRVLKPVSKWSQNGRGADETNTFERHKNDTFRAPHITDPYGGWAPEGPKTGLKMDVARCVAQMNDTLLKDTGRSCF